MTKEHIMFLVNMTLEKPPWGKPVRDRCIYLEISKHEYNKEKTQVNLVQ
jgi:hypothetical protein